MREFFHRFMTNRYWFIGTIMVVFATYLFFWHLIDPEGYYRAINEWLKSLVDLFGQLLTLALVCFGLYLIVTKGLMGGSSSKGKKH